MARVETIVAGGGVGATSPFTVNALTYITTTDPPFIGAITISQFVTGANQGIIIASGATDPQPTATELLRVKGGAIIEGTGADSVVVGRGASGISNCVALGRLASAASTGNVAIGANSSAAATTSVAVGSSANASNNLTTAVGASTVASAQGCTALGQGASATGTNATAIGLTSSASGTGAICIGNGIANATGAIVITGNAATANAFRVIIIAGGTVTARANEQIWIHAGGTTPSTAGATGGTIFIGGTNGAALSITHADCIIIGMNQGSFLANTAIIGGAGTPITTMCVGRGDTHTATSNLLFRMTNASGTNIAAGALTLQGGLSTGNAVTGAINFQTGLPGAGGTTLQTARIGASVRASATAADTDLMVYDVDNATLERVTVGAADSGGAGFKLLRVPN